LIFDDVSGYWASAAVDFNQKAHIDPEIQINPFM